MPIHDEKSQERMREKSSVHSREVNEEEKPERNLHQLESVFFMFYQLLMALWMVAFYALPRVQLALLIMTNLLFLCYHLRFRPQLNAINLIFTVLFLACLVALEAMFLYFLDNTSITASQKTSAAFPFLVAADVFCVLLVLWVLWRAVWEASFYWNNFKKTQLYLEFADHDYAGEEEQTEQFSLYEKRAEKLEVGLGDLVIDEIIERVGAEGERIIAVKKKRLRKK
jgi:hypothetical protein